MPNQGNERHEQARNSLPDDLKSVFDDFSTDFRLATSSHQGASSVSSMVLAEMVRAGWRLLEEPDEARQKARDFRKTLDGLVDSRGDFDEFHYSYDAWTSVAAAYLRAGNVLCDVMENATSRDTALLFPALFSYRQFLELSLKSLIYLGQEAPGCTVSKKPKGHILQDLYQLLEATLSDNVKSTTSWINAEVEDGKLVGGELTGKVEDDLDLLRNWCARFENVDPTGDRFRYPEGLSGPAYDYPNLKTLFGLDDIPKLRSEMKTLNEAIHHTGTAIAVEIEQG